jgi:hypothetical protein
VSVPQSDVVLNSPIVDRKASTPFVRLYWKPIAADLPRYLLESPALTISNCRPISRGRATFKSFGALVVVFDRIHFTESFHGTKEGAETPISPRMALQDAPATFNPILTCKYSMIHDKIGAENYRYDLQSNGFIVRGKQPACKLLFPV